MPIHTATRRAAPVSRNAAERAHPARAAAQLAARPGKPLPPIARPVVRQLRARALLPRQLRPAPAPTSTPPVQRTIADDANAIRAQRNTTHDAVLRKILAEVIQTYDAANVTPVWGPSPYTSHMHPTGAHGVNRAYSVVIDETQYPDATKRESILAHELIHASSDDKYAFNRDNRDSALNLLHNRRRPVAEQHQRQTALRHEVLWRLKGQVELDRVTLGNALADHLIDRLDRAIPAASQEFDTVLTELLYYLSKAAPGHAGTGTFKEIRRGADAAYQARNLQTPMKTSYTRDLPALQAQRQRRDAKDYFDQNHLAPEAGTNAAFTARIALAKTALDAAAPRNIKSTFEEAWRALVKINLAALGAEATTIATAQSLGAKGPPLAGNSPIKDILTVKAWIAEARKKYAKSWFGWGLNTAITNLEAILARMATLSTGERTGLGYLDTLVPFE